MMNGHMIFMHHSCFRGCNCLDVVFCFKNIFHNLCWNDLRKLQFKDNALSRNTFANILSEMKFV